MPKNKKIHFRIQTKLHDELTREAVNRGISTNRYIEWLIIQAIELNTIIRECKNLIMKK